MLNASSPMLRSGLRSRSARTGFWHSRLGRVSLWLIILSLPLLSGCILFWAVPLAGGKGGGSSGSSGSPIIIDNSPITPTTGSSVGTKNVSGVVYETIYGSVKIAPLGGTRVIIQGTGVITQTTTASDGSFSFSDMTDGLYSVTIEKSGYTDNKFGFDSASEVSGRFSRSITKANPNHIFIQPSIQTDINTFNDTSYPRCQVSVPAGAVTTSVEAELTPYITVSDLPGNFPAGVLPIIGANLKTTSTTNFTSGVGAECYIALPSFIRPETLTGATIKLMEYINGTWTLITSGNGAYISSGQWAGYLGPDTGAPAKITGCNPWCYVVQFANQTIANYAYISGTVLDSASIPISNILVAGHGASAVTDKNGVYRLGPLTVINGQTLIPVTAYFSGYLPSNRFIEVQPGDNLTNINFTIKSISDVAILGGSVKNTSNLGLATIEVAYQRSPAIKSLTYDNRGTTTDVTDDTFTVVPAPSVVPTGYQWTITQNNSVYTSTLYSTATVVISNLMAEADSMEMVLDIGAYRVACNVSLPGGQESLVDGGFQIALSEMSLPIIQDIQLPIIVELGAEVMAYTSMFGNYRFIDVPVGEPLTVTARATNYVTQSVSIALLNATDTVTQNFVLVATGADNTAPQVSSSSPVNNTVDVELNPTVTITFSEAMNNSTLDNSNITFSGPGGAIPVQISYNNYTYMVTLTLSNPLAYSATYTVTVSTNARDMAGLGLQSQYAFSFTALSDLTNTPAGFTATALSYSQIGLAWQDNSTNETGFKIERGLSGSGPWAQIYTAAPNATSYVDTGLAQLTQYYYRVKAYNMSGESGYAPVVSATTLAAPTTPPSAPSGLSATAVSSSAVNLAWTDNSTDEDGFYVERRIGSSGTYAQIASLVAGTTYYSNAPITASTTYYYRVRAFNIIGNSAYTAEVTVTTPAPPPGPPAAPANLAAVAASATQVNLTWEDKSDNEDGFLVYHKTGDSGSWMQATTLPANNTWYYDVNLNPSTKYYFKVRGYNSYGYGAYSNETNATTPAPSIDPPTVPANLTATAASSTTINLNWNDNSNNEDGFKIYRSSGGATFNQIGSTPVNTNSYSDSGLMSNSTYYYRVSAYNTFDESPKIPSSGSIQATTWPGTPSAPWLTTPYTGATEVSLKPAFVWTSSGTSHQLQVSTANTFSTTIINQSNITGTSYTLVSNLTANTIYYWRVKASNISGASDWSSVYGFTTTTAPSTPINLTGTAISAAQINVYWTDNSNNEDGFKLFRSTDNITFTQIVTQTNTFYTDTGLEANITYYYQAKAYNTAGESNGSNIANIPTWPPAPPQPTLASPADATPGIALNPTLTWNAATYAAYYYLQLDTTNSFTTPVVNDQYINGATTSYPVSNLFASTTYYWRVNARNTSGTSDWSAVRSFTTDSIPAQPINMSATAVSSTQINLSWEDKSSNEAGFQVEWSTDGSYFYSISPPAGQNQNTYTHNTASPNTTYYYRVYAYNSVGNSAYSNVDSDTTWPPAPDVPLLNSPATGTTAIPLTPTLAWYSASYAATYQLQVATDNTFAGASVVVSQSGIVATSYDVTVGLNPETTYYWHVKSVNISGQSNWSEVRSFTTIAYQPDLWLRLSYETDPDYVGDGIWNSTGQDQTKQAIVSAVGNVVTYYIKVQNDGETLDVFTLVGTSGNSDWALSYYDPIGVDITLSMTTTGFSTTYLNSGESITIRAEMVPLTDTAITLSSFITATSHGYPAKRDVVKAITDVAKWVEVAAGESFNIGRKTDGTLWAWGANYNGQLGLGDTNDRWGPVQIGSDANWAQVSAGMSHCLAVKTNGTLWAWGNNLQGELGQGSTTPSKITTPTQVTSDANWVEAAAGSGYSLARRTNGTLWAWGSNTMGQLGLGDISGNHYSPTQEITYSTNWAQIAAGGSHSLARKTDNTIYSWGSNSMGQLGRVVSGNQYTPTVVDSATDWVQIAAGSAHSLARKNIGALYAWGGNLDGQLGMGNTDPVYKPTQVPSFACEFVRAGWSHTIARKTNGTLWTWGANYNGQLGLGHNISPISSTTQVPDFSNCAFVSAGGSHSVAIKSNGTLWTWGYNWNGQLGQGDKKSRYSPTMVYLRWIVVSAGGSHTLGVKSDGTLWAWGYNGSGQLGMGDNNTRYYPTQVSTNTDWAFIDCGDSHSLAIKTNGTLWAWGDNWFGQLGLGDSGGGTSRYSPTQEYYGYTDWATASAGVYHSLAIRGSPPILYAWGSDDFGQLGQGGAIPGANKNTPTTVGLTNPSMVSAGAYHSICVTTGGNIYGFGRNSMGALGLNPGDWSDHSTPLVSNFIPAGGVKSLSAGGNHTAVIDGNGQLWTTGYNYYGQLGLGNQDIKNVFTQVNAATDWARVATGSSHTIASKTGGTLYAWGYNWYGQLGDGTSGTGTDKWSPVQVGSNTDWSRIGTGYYHSLAVKQSNSLWGWGSNISYELGLGDTTNRNSPTKIK